MLPPETTKTPRSPDGSRVQRDDRSQRFYNHFDMELPPREGTPSHGRVQLEVVAGNNELRGALVQQHKYLVDREVVGGPEVAAVAITRSQAALETRRKRPAYCSPASTRGARTRCTTEGPRGTGRSPCSARLALCRYRTALHRCWPPRWACWSDGRPRRRIGHSPCAGARQEPQAPTRPHWGDTP
jgi:hypothetical protein